MGLWSSLCHQGRVSLVPAWAWMGGGRSRSEAGLEACLARRNSASGPKCIILSTSREILQLHTEQSPSCCWGCAAGWSAAVTGALKTFSNEATIKLIFSLSEAVYEVRGICLQLSPSAMSAGHFTWWLTQPAVKPCIKCIAEREPPGEPDRESQPEEQWVSRENPPLQVAVKVYKLCACFIC